MPKTQELSERSVLVLTSLAGGDKHGYVLIKDVEEFAGLRLGPGTLYAALSRLEREGLIEPLPETDRRRPYRITARGSDVLLARLQTLSGVTELGMRRLQAAT